MISELEGCDFNSEEAAFWLLITELEGCDLHVQSEFGALPNAADSTELSLVEVDADLSSPVVTSYDCATAVANEQCVLLPAMSVESSTAYTGSSSSRRPTVSGATATGHRLIPRQFKSSFQSLCASRRRLSIYSICISTVYHSAELMRLLLIYIIITTQCIVLAIKDCAVLSICHTGCDPPLPAHYAQVLSIQPSSAWRRTSSSQPMISRSIQPFISPHVRPAAVTFYIWLLSFILLLSISGC